jgi:hypothetical protein
MSSVANNIKGNRESKCYQQIAQDIIKTLNKKTEAPAVKANEKIAA